MACLACCSSLSSQSLLPHFSLFCTPLSLSLTLQDVSDKITDEDQLLGAKQKDAPEEEQQQQDKGQEEEDDKSKVGMWCMSCGA